MEHALYIIHRYRTNGGRAVLHQPFPERCRLSIAGQVHNGFCLHFPGQLRLCLLRFIIAHIFRNAQIHIHLCAKSLADGIGVKRFVVYIGRNNNGSFCHSLPDIFCRHPFIPGCRFHFLRYDSLSCRFQLCHDSSHEKKPAIAGFEQTDFLLPYVGINRIKFKGSDFILSVH